MFDDMKMGLPKPTDDSSRGLTDFNVMRQEITHGARDSALIQNCLRQAEYAGLSGEDKYTLLAYQALIALEVYWKQALTVSALSPIPPMIVKDNGKITG